MSISGAGDVLAVVVLAIALWTSTRAFRFARQTRLDELWRRRSRLNGIRRIVSNGRERRARLYIVLDLAVVFVSLVAIADDPPQPIRVASRAALVVIIAAILRLINGDAGDRDRIASYDPPASAPRRRREDAHE